MTRRAFTDRNNLIIEKLQRGECGRDIAREFRISAPMVSKIKNRLNGITKIKIRCPGCSHFVGYLEKLILDKTFRLEKITCGKCKYQFSLVGGRIRKFIKSTDAENKLCWVSGDKHTTEITPIDVGPEDDCYYEIVVSDEV
jgi:hypothetical protein